MTVTFSVERQIGFVMLNRPNALHALTLDMIEALMQQLTLWQTDPEVLAVVVQAVPGKAFCAGGDVRWIYEHRGQVTQQLNFFQREYRLNELIYEYPKPYIALMDGFTMGGGVGISLHGSHPVASERFVFAMPETAIGFFPDIGASYLLSRCPGLLGLYLGLTGDRINASDAYALGLVKTVVLAEHFPSLIQLLLTNDLSKDPYEVVSSSIAQFAVPQESSALLSRKPDIDDCFEGDTVEDILLRLSQVDDPWFQGVSATLQRKSPMSLKVTLRQLRLAKSMTLSQCLAQDEILAHHFFGAHDFYEGVRAVVVDKDQTPHWQPQALEEVTPDMVETYFKVI